VGNIHPSAVIDKKAQIAESATIGPFCVIEADVVVGENTALISSVVLANGTRLGNNVTVHPGAVIGTAPQDLKYAGEKTVAIVGDRTVVRECATINRGTIASRKTVVGSDVLIMAYCHVAHDCIVGDKVVMANGAQLGGHVEIGEWAIVGGLAGINQFMRIGAHCMIAACGKVTKDVPPYCLSGREPMVVEGINVVGLRRRGFTPDDILEIQQFYNVLFRSGFNISTGIAKYTETTPIITQSVQLCIDFIQSSKRGILRSS